MSRHKEPALVCEVTSRVNSGCRIESHRVSRVDDRRTVRPRWALLGVRVLAVTLLCLVAAVSLPAQAPASKLSDAKNDLQSTRSSLNKIQTELDQLTGRYMRAEARLYELDNAIEVAEKDVVRSRQDLEIVRAQLIDRMVRVYKEGRGSVPIFLEVLFEGGDFTTVMERLDLLNLVAAQDNDMLDQVARHLQKVEELERELTQMRDQQEVDLKELEAAQAAMDQRMTAVAAEYRRLKKRVAALEEEARRAAEAARARARAVASSTPATSAAAKGFVFPVDGPHSFINDWGFPRSGGRSHKGTDIMAPRGTPVVAVVSGRISRTSYGSGLGGTTIWLNGNNGTSYYYAHLEGIAGGIRGGVSVRAGQVIGYVGSSGNARGGAPHLHFEIRPGGGGAVNPYFILKASD